MMKVTLRQKKIIAAVSIVAVLLFCLYIIGNEHSATIDRHNSYLTQRYKAHEEELCPSCFYEKQNAMPGTAFWVHIGSNIESDEQFHTWREQFMTAQVNRLDVKQNDIDIEVAGQDGIVSVTLIDSVVSTEPAAPMGILTLNGQDLGRPILEQLPMVARFVRQRDEAKPILINPAGTHWKAKIGYSFFEEVFDSDDSVRVNFDVAWQVQIEQSGEYYLWGQVQTMDAQHDSFWVEAAKRLPDGSFMRRFVNIDWHLGVHADWTWTRLSTPIHLEKGIWQLTLRPREYEGRIDQLFLTNDPAGKP